MSVRDWPWLLLLKRWPQVVRQAVKKTLLGEPLSLANSANWVTASSFGTDSRKRDWTATNAPKPPLAQRALQSWYPQSRHSCTNMAGKFTFHGLAEIQPTIVTALCLRWNEMNVNCNYIDYLTSTTALSGHSSKQTVSPWINYAYVVLLRTISNLLQSLIERHINSSRNKCTLASRHRRRDLIERFCGPAIEGVSWLINSLIESVNEWKSEPFG